MRIISQNGRYDFPYEELCFAIANDDRRKIIAYSPNDSSHICYEFGRYKTFERTDEVFILMREMYCQHRPVFSFPKNE